MAHTNVSVVSDRNHGLPQRTFRPIISEPMNEEQREGYRAALNYGARKTAAKIRAHKVSLGGALLSARIEIGPDRFRLAMIELHNQWWAFITLRYADQLSHLEWCAYKQIALCQETREHAEWVLENLRQLSDIERHRLDRFLALGKT